MRGVLLQFAVAVLLWGGAVSLGPRADARTGAGEELFYYPSGRMLREAVLGYEQAASALAWLRTVQYYGEHAKTDRRYDMMYHVCDIVTDLDPKFEETYIFGSFVLLTEGNRPEEGLRLLEKGRREHPDSWRLLFESGFVEYLALQDYGKASDYFRQAASKPGAPEYVARFAAYVSEKAGSLEAALALWVQCWEATENPEVKRRAERQIEILRARIAERDAAGES